MAAEEIGVEDELAPAPSRIEALRKRWARVEASAAGKYWSQLTAVDFLNSSFAFAAMAVLCAFPFLAVLAAATGGDFREAVVARMGLDPEAARAVDALMTGGDTAVGSLTVFSAVWILVGAIGMAATLQSWYLRIYDQPRSKGILRRLGYQTAGIAAFPLYIWFQLLIFDAARPAGGRVLIFVLTLVVSVPFWWCSAYFLLLRNVAWRRLFPAGLATALFITGLGVFSWVFFSDEIITGQKNYGPAGVALALISYAVGYGVCLHLGAVFGRIWLDWRVAGESSAIKPPAADAAPAELTGR